MSATVMDTASLQGLKRVVFETPLIDHHAHPLLGPLGTAKDYDGRYPLLSFTSEADGPALPFVASTLAHSRAKRQLAARLGCEPDLVAETLAKNNSQNPSWQRNWLATCLKGIQTILVDDGLSAGDGQQLCSVEDLSALTTSRCRRIVRIETLLEDLVGDCVREHGGKDPVAAFESLLEKFDSEVARCLASDSVAGFKSIICYRGGLDIDPQHHHQAAPLKEFCDRVFPAVHRSDSRDDDENDNATKVRLRRLPAFHSFFISLVARRITRAGTQKPIQFHVGLGDNDITLAKASPARLQPFISAYPDVPIVLLHTGWPYAREAAYLASVYHNVYVDLGEAFPVLSRQGQETVLTQLLEVAPWTKILGGTDGHFWPETYWLGQKQLREALAKILENLVTTQDMTWEDANSAARAILFNNCNRLYNLGLPEVGNRSSSSSSSVIVPKDGVSLSPGEEVRKIGSPNPNHLAAMQDFLLRYPQVEWIGIYFTEMTNMPRMRALSVRRVLDLLQQDPTSPLVVGVSAILFAVLQNDAVMSTVGPVGAYRLVADHKTLVLGPRPNFASLRGDVVMGNGGDGTSVSVPYCPRTALQRVIETARQQGLTFEVGFEIEIVFMRESPDGRLLPLDSRGHSWARDGPMNHALVKKVIEPTILMLETAGIVFEMFHAEGATGQYEIIIRHLPPLEAADTMQHVRLALAAAATAEGFHATMHPKPFSDGLGSGLHAHISISSDGGDDPAVYEPFWAGVLNHFPAVCAFTLPHQTSYQRAIDNAWSGGTYLTWGTENREATLRKVTGSHWEVRQFDGMANPHLGLAAILAVGIVGHRQNEVVKWKEAHDVAAVMDDATRAALGLLKLPSSLPQALDRLKSDMGDTLRELLGTELVNRYIDVKEAELDLWNSISEEQQWQWLVDRY